LEHILTDDTPLPTTPDADLADAIAACPTYLAPLNSIGAGGVCFSALESFEWMPLETAADLRAVVARLRAAPAQNDEFVAAMRAGLASGHVASAPMMRRVDAILARHAAISQDDGDLEAHAFDELAPALKLADALQMPEV
jgi:uncharacterized protein (DUF885 family)